MFIPYLPVKEKEQTNSSSSEDCIAEAAEATRYAIQKHRQLSPAGQFFQQSPVIQLRGLICSLLTSIIAARFCLVVVSNSAKSKRR